MQFFDSLVNFVSGMGTQRDKAAATGHVMTEMSDAELVAFFRSSWLAKKIITIPSFDTFRKWRSWQTDEANITAIEAEEKRLNVRNKYREADMKARLYGGAAIYIGTGDPDPASELNVAAIRKGGVRFLNVFLPRDLAPGEIDRDPESPYFNLPTYYEMRPTASATAPIRSTGPQVRIHPSRLVIFRGDPLPDEELLIARSGVGWGDSILLARKEAILQAEATAANIATLVFEAKVDIFRIPNLMTQIANKQYRDNLTERMTLAATLKGINGALVMDKEEEYESKTMTFGTLPDLMDRFSQNVSGAADIPMTRLFGQAPAGLNSTGESDLRNYYDHISAHQELDVNPVTKRLDDAIVYSALGSYPKDCHFIWSSLWQISDKERADIGKIGAETIKALVDTQLYPPEALANAGANMLTENSIMPGLDKEIEKAGGLPDYDLEKEIEAQERMAIAEAANQNSSKGGVPKRAVNDAPPPPRTLYVRRDVTNANAIVAHYKAQGLTTMDASKMHVTVIYSKTPVDWFETGEPWASKLTLSAGGPRANALFGPPGLEDTLVLMITASELRWRHEAFKAAGAESDYDKYNPHISLVYMRNGETIPNWEELTPYQGEIELGPEIYEEVKVKPNG